MPLSEILGLLIIIGAGLGFGSYSTMIYWRSTSGEVMSGKWLGGKRSHCVHCNHKLRTRDLFPVFNWLLTKGKCHFCGKKINKVYFFVEFFIALFCTLLYLKFGVTEQYIFSFGIALFLVVLACSDYSFKNMPDRILLFTLITAMVYRAMQDGTAFDMVQSLTWVVILSVGYRKLYETITKKEIKNYSYLKFLAVMAIWFQPAALISFLGFSVLAAPSLLIKSKHGVYGVLLCIIAVFHIFFPEAQHIMWLKTFFQL